MNPLLLSFPDCFETERLLIRAPQPGDGHAVSEAVSESLSELQPWMPWARSAPTPESSELGIREAWLAFQARTDLRLQLWDKATGMFVGSSGLHRMDWHVRRFEIGYWIRTSYSGRGLMTEAVDGITRFAIDQLSANRIEIRCDSRNVRSANVARRLGFTLEGVLRGDCRDVYGQLRDTMIFAKVRGAEY